MKQVDREHQNAEREAGAAAEFDRIHTEQVQQFAEERRYRDILAEVKAHRVSAGRTAPLEPAFADALIRECEHMREREAHFAKVLGITDGGRYRNDWDATLEVVREIADAHRAVQRAEIAHDGVAYPIEVRRCNDALDTLARLLPEAQG